MNNQLQEGKESREIEVVQLVTFEVNGQLFGIEVTKVQEVIRFDTITATPGSSEIIEGVIDLRGNIIPVIDLKNRFHIPTTPNKKGKRIIITEVRDYIFGFIVDKVNEVHTFAINEFEPPPPGVSAPGSEYTVGMAHKGDELLLFLDIEKVLDIERLLEQEEL